jgi:hypothetical protein
MDEDGAHWLAGLHRMILIQLWVFYMQARAGLGPRLGVQLMQS